METIDILELFEKCINGKGGCDICPHKGKSDVGSPCVTGLGRDVINYVNALKEQIEYYEEVIEEYETAELERQELADKLADAPLWTPYDSPTTWIHDDSSSWSISLDDCATTTSESASHVEGLATTASSTYDSTVGTSTCSLGYDLDSLTTTASSTKWELESALERATEAVEVELKKKDKKPRWFEKWTEKA